MKTKNKQGISLIVLVITIIVMVILAAAIVITLNNSGIIGKASDAVEQANLATIREVASIGWTEAYLKETTETKNDAYYQKEVIAYLKAQGMTDEQLGKYKITATTTGVDVELLNASEHGLYYDEAYIADIVQDGVPITVAYVFHKDGSAEMYAPIVEWNPANGLYIIQSEPKNSYTYENNILTFNGQSYQVSKDGKTIEQNGQVATLQLDLEHGPYRGYTYKSEVDSNGLVYSIMLEAGNRGTIEVKMGDTVVNSITSEGIFSADEHIMVENTGIATLMISLDGKKVLWQENNILITIVGNPERQEKDEEDVVENYISHNGIIPEGGTYYTGVTSENLGVYTGDNVITYTAGQAFPSTAKVGDVYIYGDYEYRYNAQYSPQEKWDIFSDEFVEAFGLPNGWGLSAMNRSKSSYSEILGKINNFIVLSMNSAFINCTEMTTAPKIPSTITGLAYAFRGCVKLTTAPDMSEATGLTSLYQTFMDCEKLVNVGEIPQNVTDMEDTFQHCTSLVTAPTIPSRVEILDQTFLGCTSLTGDITINANPTVYSGCFSSTEKPIHIIGSCSTTTKANLAGTTNGNVTY